MYICFKDEEERENGIKILNGYVWKGKTLTATHAKAAPDPLVKRRNENIDGGDQPPPVKRMKTVEETTTDLVHLSYADQLRHKQEKIKETLKNFGQRVFKENYSMRSFIDNQRSKYEGLPCQLLDIIPSPQIDGYRNKCEFTIGKNSTGEKVVGFRLGSYSSGSIEVGSAANLRNINDRMKQTIILFEEFIRSSKFDVFEPECHTGQYKQLAVRTSKSNDELMVIVGVNPQDSSEEQLAEIKKEICDFFTIGNGKELNVTSLYYLGMPKRQSGVKYVEEHLHGTSHITETIHGLKFRISPSAFFQVNTACAEILYQTAIDFATAKDSTTVFDICCGTGTVGLCFAKHVANVIGVELVAEAIEDAKFNANANNISNCNFIQGFAEDTISSMMSTARFQNNKDIIAVLDPPRAGLHNRAINSIRSARHLNRIVYISCAPAGATKNWCDLMRPPSKTMSGDPFVPVKAVAVDMFPHTHHTELIILFERQIDDDDDDKKVMPVKNVDEKIIEKDTMETPAEDNKDVEMVKDTKEDVKNGDAAEAATSKVE